MTYFYTIKFKDGTEHHFGCLAAIYSTFTEDQIGAKVQRLYAHGVARGKPFIGKKCFIKQNILKRKKTNRGRK